MKELKENWLTEGLIDYEYKKYMLLAYLRSVDEQFTRRKLYPPLGELVKHYRNLEAFRTRKNEANKSFPKELDRVDLHNFLLKYKAVIEDDSIMEELDRILDFSLPAMKEYLEEGRELYDWIEQQLEIRPVGIVPLEINYGYIFIRNGGDRRSSLYEYQLTLFENAGDRYRGLNTRYLSTYTTSITTTYESLKIKIMNRFKLQRPPAVYALESTLKVPMNETLLPIARRLLVSRLMQQAG